jgi:hypothetical protein
MPPVKYLGFNQVVPAGEVGDKFEIRPTADSNFELWRHGCDGTWTLIQDPNQLIALLLAFVVGGCESNVPKDRRLPFLP